MSFLTLTQGDPIGLDSLKKLVENRYGISPPAMDALRVTYQGKAKVNLGPFPMNARVDAVATYRFPDRMKWSFKLRLLRVIRSVYATAFDGETVYEQQGVRPAEPITDPDLVESARRRAWSETVYFISPLIADHRVRVEGVDTTTFRAIAPDHPDTVAVVRLGAGDALAAVEIDRVDPATGQPGTQRIVPTGELTSVDGVIMPATLERYWGDRLFMTLSPVKVELNPELAENEFVLEKEDLLVGIVDEDNTPSGEEAADE